MKKKITSLSFLVQSLLKRIKYILFGGYPRVMMDEVAAVTAVLRSPYWNMAYGKDLVHERLENEFAEYVGSNYAIAVNTGGMALQMSMRGLGCELGDEVVTQIDTCSATAFAIHNAGCIPIFSDISNETFMLSESDLDSVIQDKTKALIATHMWGNPENIPQLKKICAKKNLVLIEDACLALGARLSDGAVGSNGDVGVFSFGCLKPVQAGEGGMIVTNDEALAKELRSMRHWGDRTIDFGTRDTTQLSWNGRMSEIVAAVAREQLRGYPAHLSVLRDAVSHFNNFLSQYEGIELVLGSSKNIADSAFTQIVLRIDSKYSVLDLRNKFSDLGISTWYANFELINSLSFYKNETYKKWIYSNDFNRINKNYARDYPVAQSVFAKYGIGFPKTYFLSTVRLRYLMRQFNKVMLNCNETITKSR